MSGSVRTVRFSDLVKHFGPAHLVTLWSDPKTDKSFMQAVEENRVLTVTLHNVGSRKDVGVVGFDPKPSATYIVFSKPLSAAGGTKVVGLKYELIEEAAVTDPVPPAQLQFRPKVHQRLSRPEKAEFVTDIDKRDVPEPKRVVPVPEQTRPQKFRVSIGVTTKGHMQKEIEAASVKEARAKALQEVKKEPVDVTNATVTWRIISAQKVSS